MAVPKKQKSKSLKSENFFKKSKQLCLNKRTGIPLNNNTIFKRLKFNF